MSKFAYAAIAAVGLLLAAPTAMTPASAQGADVRISVGDRGIRSSERVVIKRDRPGYRHYGRSNRDRACRTTTIIKNGQRTTIKRCN